MARAHRRAVAALVVAVGAATACRSTAPPGIGEAPDPTSPPAAGSVLTAPQIAAARAAVAYAERGDRAGAARAMRDLPADHPVSALTAVEVRFLLGEAVAGEAAVIAAADPTYAAAWAVTGLAARREGDLRRARAALRRAAELQPQAGWQKAADEAENVLVATLLRDATAKLASGDTAGALAATAECLAVRPTQDGARMIAVRAHLVAGDVQAATLLVPALPDTADGLELKGRVAEKLGQWELAIELYGRMPASDPRRCQLLAEARRQWRVANAAPALGRALKAVPLTRRGLAMIIAAAAPSLADTASGPVAVFEDVVQLPERREIVVVARAGVMPGDAVGRRWSPDRPVRPRELATAVSRLASVLRRPVPSWCGEQAVAGCDEVPDPVTGAKAAALVERLVAPEEDECRRP